MLRSGESPADGVNILNSIHLPDLLIPIRLRINRGGVEGEL